MRQEEFANCEEHNLYSTLGVNMLADVEEIRQAWRRACLRHHPDRQPDDPLASPRFQAAQHAYEVLKDSTLRAEYDKALLHRLHLQEYLRRFRDLILTASGLGLPLEQERGCASAPPLPRHLMDTPYVV